MKECNLLQTYEIFLKLIYLKLLQEYWTYEWDLWNRLVKVVQFNAPDEGECVEVSYEYDALNHRTSRISKGETTKYAYGRNGALAYQEKTKDGSVTKRSFTYLNNEIVGFTDKTGKEESVYYTVTDIQGSITEVYDNDSNLVWKSGYTAFGEIAGETVDLIDFDGMYTGCDYDVETRLTYHWNRWRSEDGSAFISEDPIRDGMNWYGYAGCNPMVYVDPTGLAPYLNGIYDGPYNPDYNPGTPEIGPPPNPNGMPQNQTPNITGPSNLQTSLPPVPDVKTDGRNLNEKIIETERKSKTVLDWIQTALDVLGVIPVFGEAADGINGLISLGRGDTLGAALSFASMIPVVGDSIGKGGKAVKQLVKYADDGLSKATKVASKTISDATKTKGLHRPYIRKSTREAVENAAQKNAKGQFIDPNTLQPIEGKYDLGHKRGNEFRTEKAKAEREGLTQSQFNDRMNNPDLYQIENPSSNRSHKYEAPRE